MRLLNHIKSGKVIRLVNQPKQRLIVMEDLHFRWLTFNNIIQSVMSKRVPHRLLMPHQQALFLPLLFSTPNRILELGLGGGNFTRMIKHLIPDCELITAECDKDVIAAFDDYFNPERVNLDVRHQTGEQLLEQSHGAYDWVVCDIYDQNNHEFLAQVKQSLSKQIKPVYWTINLPDMQEKKINHLLESLKAVVTQLANNYSIEYQIRFIEIPHFKNILIYIIPMPATPLSQEKSILPNFLYRKLMKAWLHSNNLPTKITTHSDK